MRKKALITGITGQDGSYLAEFLLEKEYDVFGLERRASNKRRENLKAIEGNIKFISGDLLDQTSLIQAIKEAEPDEVYNLAAQSFVGDSWRQPVYTNDVNGSGVIRLLEAIRTVDPVDPTIKFYQASSSEMFGKVKESPQNENTRFYPRSPYGVAKLTGHGITVNYRESYGLFAVNGILFNHESTRRGLEFVTRKISNSVARIKLGLQEDLELGKLDSKRDWGHAPDYVEAMWLMLQQEQPEDYVIATGEAHSIRDFVEEAFKLVKMDLKWEGERLDEIGKVDGKTVVKINSEFYRPADVDDLRGDFSKAKRILDWEPKTKFNRLVKIMVEADLKELSK